MKKQTEHEHDDKNCMKNKSISNKKEYNIKFFIWSLNSIFTLF